VKQLIELYAAAVILSRKEAHMNRKTRGSGRNRHAEIHGPRTAMVYSRVMRVRLALAFLIVLLLPFQFIAQAVPAAAPDFSGMYEFLRDGEFVQLTVEDKGSVTGFISRFGDSESDKGVFMNQFFKSGKLDGNKLSFITEPVHGIWFEFVGAVARGAGKKPEEEAYYVLQGTLTRYTTDSDKKTTSQARSVELKSFPRDAGSN
jgi:hypothetical protein